MDTLKEAREKKGVKLQAVADHLSISRQTYARYERNQGEMSIEMALAVCDFLGVDIDSIFFANRVKFN